MTTDPAPAETLKLLPESTPVLRFGYISVAWLFVGFPVFPDFQLPGKRENFPVIFLELNCFAFFFLVFSISDLIFSILLRCFDKLSFNFSIFSTN